MKKLFAMLVAAACTLGAMATDYAGKIAVSINGVGASQAANVTLNQQEDGTYTLLIKNFKLVTPETELGVGNIVVDSLVANTEFEEFGYTLTSVENRNVTISEGDDPNVDFWFGPTLGEVPITMTTHFNEQALLVSINIYFAPLEQNIKVNFVGNNPDAPQPVKGDVTGEGTVDIADVNAVINIMLGK